MRLFTIAAAALLISAGASQAASFDFGEYARDNGEGSWDVVTGGSLTVDGITVEASSFLHDGEDVVQGVSYAYLDGPDGDDQNAGLGVCSSGLTGGDQCVISGDDNTGGASGADGIFEGLVLEFSKAVFLSDLVFRAANHDILESGLIAVGDATAEDPTDLLVWDLAGEFFDYASDEWVFAAIGGEGSVEFYIESATVAAVPLPAAGWLLLGGLGGLAAMKRRKKA